MSELNNSSNVDPIARRVSTEESLALAQNARQIAEELKIALDHINKANQAITEAMALIHAKEKEPEFVMGALPSLSGLLDLAQTAVRKESMDWHGYATARERS